MGKRSNEHSQLSKEDYDALLEGSPGTGSNDDDNNNNNSRSRGGQSSSLFSGTTSSFQRADDKTLANRRIIKTRRTSNTSTSGIGTSSSNSGFVNSNIDININNDNFSTTIKTNSTKTGNPFGGINLLSSAGNTTSSAGNTTSSTGNNSTGNTNTGNTISSNPFSSNSGFSLLQQKHKLQDQDQQQQQSLSDSTSNTSNVTGSTNTTTGTSSWSFGQSTLSSSSLLSNSTTTSTMNQEMNNNNSKKENTFQTKATIMDKRFLSKMLQIQQQKTEIEAGADTVYDLSNYMIHYQGLESMISNEWENYAIVEQKQQQQQQQQQQQNYSTSTATNLNSNTTTENNNKPLSFPTFGSTGSTFSTSFSSATTGSNGSAAYTATTTTDQLPSSKTIPTFSFGASSNANNNNSQSTGNNFFSGFSSTNTSTFTVANSTNNNGTTVQVPANNNNTATVAAVAGNSNSIEEDDDGNMPQTEPTLVAQRGNDDPNWTIIGSFERIKFFRLSDPKQPALSSWVPFACGKLDIEQEKNDNSTSTVCRMIMRDAITGKVQINMKIISSLSTLSTTTYKLIENTTKSIGQISFSSINDTSRGYEGFIMKCNLVTAQSLYQQLLTL